MQQDLRLMSLPPERASPTRSRMTSACGTAAAATIDGSIASLGKSYVITLQAITCQGGATLAREQIQADDKEHVLNAVGTAATAMRAKLGESLSSIQKLNRPLEQATTPSLEALQNYTAGYAEMEPGPISSCSFLCLSAPSRSIRISPWLTTCLRPLSTMPGT